ncbi:hypothetical protein Goklo_029217 [Gossypium klotzschianum]|uniref:Uncharacterized protein n=1 Tax=Gossypium klotzschianum TaxID=34286 RepID=A0A7J8W3N4_9ROSI|nr:hypothetical protein [Gossypium klotzschianum]
MVHRDTKKKVDVFALSIYGLIFFLEHCDTLMKHLRICFIDWTRESHLSQQFWPRHLDL